MRADTKTDSCSLHRTHLSYSALLGTVLIVGYADDATTYAVIPRALSRPQVIESLNQNLAAIHS